MSNNKPVFIIQHNHFDPIWRRCWDWSFDYKGKRIQPYADLEEYVIDIWMKSAKKGAAFSEGQAVVFRKYLERNPNRLKDMKSLVKKGIIDLTAAGETVADTNMPSGETLLRNLIMGQLYFQEIFGMIPTVGWLEDAFGQSAQIPQIFRGCECDQVQRLCYKQVSGKYWKGLDGSVLYIGGVPGFHSVGSCVKLPPCTECCGTGCECCEGYGIDFDAGRISDEELTAAFSTEHHGDPCSLICIGGEESIPNPHIVELLEKARKEHGFDLRFGGFNAVSELIAGDIARVNDPNVETTDQVEANPVSTGCYVTRIRIKQDFRRVENFVNAAERWATVAHLMGKEYPIECLTEAWRNLLFVAFHDAITSTHIDAAYYELLDMLSEAEHEAAHVLYDSIGVIEQSITADPDKDYLLVYNSESWERTDPITLTLTGTRGRPLLTDNCGHELEIFDVRAQGEDIQISFRPPRVPALGYAAIQVVPDIRPIDSGDITSAPGEIENEFFTIRVSEHGIESILDKRNGMEVFDTNDYLVNELILEDDAGHPWGTMQPPSFEERLGKYTTSVKIRKTRGLGEIILTGQYKGSDPNTAALAWRQTARLYAGYDRIDFSTDVDWDTAQRRIRLAFPTRIKTSDGIYSIPYGAVKRWKYQPEMDRLPSTNGDWPAINWVDLYGEGENYGVALLNTGVPSHKIENGVLFMSILRSPTDSWCLNEPEYYDCPDFDGARDAGVHEFTYSLIPHLGDYRAAGIERRGREVNTPLLVHIPEFGKEGTLGLTHSFLKLDAPDNVIVSAIKKTDRSDAAVIRLAETAGAPAEVLLHLENAGKKTVLTNFLERSPKPVSGKIKLDPWKIITVMLKK